MAFEVIDEWMRNIDANPTGGVAGNKPSRAVDSCFDVTGDSSTPAMAPGRASSTTRPQGPCTQPLPVYSTSRIVAGAPITGDVFACDLKPVAAAVADGTYGSGYRRRPSRRGWRPIFPDGVCAY